MAYTELISVGQPFAMIQNTVYALPSSRSVIFCETTTAIIQMSNLVAFTTSASVTLTNGQASVAGLFIRCTSGTVNVVVKKF